MNRLEYLIRHGDPQKAYIEINASIERLNAALDVAVEALKETKKMSMCHNTSQNPHEWLHELMVDIPHFVDWSLDKIRKVNGNKYE